jgi:hypothetical protein
LNGRGGGPARRLGRWNAVVCRVGNEGENRIRVVSRRERQCHRRRRIKAEGECAPFRDDEPRHNRSAKCHEFCKPLPVEAFDRQREYRFACRGDENGPSPVEFAKAAADTGVPPAAE